MKSCPKCDIGKFGHPLMRQAGHKDWLKCPVCKTIFDKKGNVQEMPVFKESVKNESWENIWGNYPFVRRY